MDVKKGTPERVLTLIKPDELNLASVVVRRCFGSKNPLCADIDSAAAAAEVGDLEDVVAIEGEKAEAVIEELKKVGSNPNNVDKLLAQTMLNEAGLVAPGAA